MPASPPTPPLSSGSEGNQDGGDFTQRGAEDNSSPLQAVWEGCDPMTWRNAAYKDTPIMVQLFKDEVALFQDFQKAKAGSFTKTAIVEVGMGTAELFSKVVDDYDVVVGIDVAQPFIDLAYEIHPNLKAEAGKKCRLTQGNAVYLRKVLREKIFPTADDFWADSTHRLTCMCMNTFGIMPDFVRAACIKEMYLCSGPGNDMIVGCWYKPMLREGFEQLYTPHPALTNGQCKESDFDFEAGDFVCSGELNGKPSDYTSHWWSEDELRKILTENFPGDSSSGLAVEFVIKGCGIFAICKIAADAKLCE